MTLGTKEPNEDIPSDPSAPDPPLLLPGPPTGVTATWSGDEEITISWTANTEATSYKIYYKEYQSDAKIYHPDEFRSNYIQIAGAYPVEIDAVDTDGTLTNTSFTHTVTAPFYGYSYVVTSVNDNGESTSSNVAFDFTLLAPYALDIVASPDPLDPSQYLVNINSTPVSGYTIGTVYDKTMKLYQASSGDPSPTNFDSEYDINFTLTEDTFEFFVNPIKVITAGPGDKVVVYGTNPSGSTSSNIETL